MMFIFPNTQKSKAKNDVPLLTNHCLSGSHILPPEEKIIL